MTIAHTDQDILEAGESIGVGFAEMAAVTTVEARKSGFVNNQLQILYEPHVAWRELRRTPKDRAVRKTLAAEGLAYSKWRRNYPSKIADRHKQLDRAVAIAGPRAYRFVSMGMPQIMGFNAKVAGYPYAKAMFDAFVEKGEPEQLRALARFLRNYRKGAALKALKAHDWETFSDIYNGPGYKLNKHDTKLARAYALHKNHVWIDPWSDGFLGIGDKGSEVRALQAGLVAGAGIGSDIQVDGDFGPMTGQAVAGWQKTTGRTVTGQVNRVAYEVIVEPHQPDDPGTEPKPKSGLAAFFVKLFQLIGRLRK